MYVSYQIQRMQAAATMTAVERRAADEEVGRLAADLSAVGQRIAKPARALGLLLPVGRRSIAAFRKNSAGIYRGGTSNLAPSPCAVSREIRES
jgi:hypothetical protein